MSVIMNYCENCGKTDCDLFYYNSKYLCIGCRDEYINQEDDTKEEARYGNS